MKLPRGGDIWVQDLLVVVYTEQQLELPEPGLLKERSCCCGGRRGRGRYKSSRPLPVPLGSVKRLPRAVVPGRACSDAINPASRKGIRLGGGWGM